MKKQIYIMRHAKSDWSYQSLQDFERPLNQRGKKDAPCMGKALRMLDTNLDLVLSSPALRAKETAQLFTENLNYSKQIHFEESFYAAEENDILRFLKRLPDSFHSILIIGHNPCMENLISTLSSSHINLTTASIALLSSNITSWQNLTSQCCQLQWFLTPRILHQFLD